MNVERLEPHTPEHSLNVNQQIYENVSGLNDLSILRCGISH